MKTPQILMTKDEAIQAMKEGHKVTHRHFSDDEWITMKDGKIIDENGYKLYAVEFWFYRESDSFKTGWSIKN